MLKCCDFVTSNVPGAPVPVYIGGARVERLYAFAPPAGAAFNVTLISHCDTCCIGVVIDTTAVPDPDVLVELPARRLRRGPRARLKLQRGPPTTPDVAWPGDRRRPTSTLPPELRPGDGRFGSGPSKVRDEAVAALAGVAHGYLGTSHRRDGVRSVVRERPRRARRPLRAARRLRGAPRHRRLDVVLGRGRVRAHRAPQLAPRDRRVLVEVRGGRHAPRRISTIRRCARPSPARNPASLDASRRRRLRVPAQRDVDRRDGPACTGPAGDALVVVDGTSAAGGMLVRRAQRSTSTTSRRRSASRATAACGSRSAPPPRSSASSA